MVYGESITTQGTISAGTVAYVSSGIYGAKNVVAGRTYYYEISLGGNIYSGWFTMPTGTADLVKVDGITAKSADGQGYGSLLQSIQTAADHAVIYLTANTDEAILMDKAVTIVRNGFTASNLAAKAGMVLVTSPERYVCYYEGFTITYAASGSGTYNATVEYHFAKQMQGTLMVAAYDANGKMLGLGGANFQAGDNGSLGVTLKATGTIATFKVFLMNASTWAPTCQAGRLAV